MEEKNNEIKNSENQKNNNYIIEENVSLNFEGKKEKKIQNKTNNKKLTNKSPIIIKKVNTNLNKKNIQKLQKEKENGRNLYYKKINPLLKSSNNKNLKSNRNKNQDFYNRNNLLAIKKIKTIVENAVNYSNYKKRNINNTKNKISKFQRNKRNLDSFDTEFNNKTYSINTFDRNCEPDLNLTQSSILPKNIRNQDKINNNKKIKKNLPPGNVSGTRMYQQYMEKLPKQIEERKKLLEIEKKEKEGELIFHPKINEKSKKLVKDIFEKEKVENLLISYGQKVKKKQLNILKENLKKEVDSTNYKPNLSKRTEKLSKINRNKRKEIIQNNNFNINPDNLDNNTIIQKEFSFDETFFKNSLKSNFKKNSINNSQYKNTKIKNGKNIPIPKLDPTNNTFDYLYFESKILDKKRENKKKELMNNLSFIPKINSKSVDYNQNKNETPEEFYNRLYQQKRNYTPIIKRDSYGRIKFNEFRDTKTGQILFKPKITRGPKIINQREKNLDSDNYYDKRLFPDLEKEKKREIYNTIVNKKEYLNQTLKMIIKNKLERYKKIFNSLDSDHDGFISSKNIRLSALDNDRLKSFTPILEELQKSDSKINFNQFCKQLDDLIEKTAKQANYFNLDENDE